MRDVSILARSVRQLVDCPYFSLAAQLRDDFGRDVTLAFLVGRAIGTAEGVEWRVPAPLVRRVA